MIEWREVSVGYDAAAVVADVTMTIERGERVALIGQNGSGKSTVLKTMAGLLRPLRGTIVRTPGIGVAYLGQQQRGSNLLPLRAEDVVMMARYPRRGLLGRLRAEDRALVAAALEQVGMTDHAAHPLRDLSGGQRQRVALAHALAGDAQLWLLDEPTTGFDAPMMARYRAILDRQRAAGTTVVVATHDVNEAARCDRVLLLAGRVVAWGAPASVLTAEHLLAAFGVELIAVEHGDHTDLVISGHGSGHPSAHDWDHHRIDAPECSDEVVPCHQPPR